MIVYVEYIDGAGKRDSVFIKVEEMMHHLMMHDMRTVRDAARRIISNDYGRPCMGIVSIELRESEE